MSGWSTRVPQKSCHPPVSSLPSVESLSHPYPLCRSSPRTSSPGPNLDSRLPSKRVLYDPFTDVSQTLSNRRVIILGTWRAKFLMVRPKGTETDRGPYNLCQGTRGPELRRSLWGVPLTGPRDLER